MSFINIKKFHINANMLKGAAWILLYVFLSVVNEVVSFNGVRTGLHPAQMICCRFFFSTLSILPFMLIMHWFYDVNDVPAVGLKEGMRRCGNYWKYLSLRILMTMAVCHVGVLCTNKLKTMQCWYALVLCICLLTVLVLYFIERKLMQYFNEQEFSIWGNFHTSNLWQHALRAGILALGIFTYTLSYMIGNAHGTMSNVSMSMNVMIGSALNPIATTLLAVFFFKDSIQGYKRFMLLNLLGVALVLCNHVNYKTMYSLFFILISVVLYGLTDIVNKYSVNRKEPLPKIMFYTNLFIVLFIFPIAYQYWQPLSNRQILTFVIAGINGNIVSFCLIKSLTYTDLSSVQLLKHLKLPWAFVCDQAIFHSIVGWQFWLGFMMVFIGSAWSTVKRVLSSQSNN